jgi:hypothetical protein
MGGNSTQPKRVFPFPRGKIYARCVLFTVELPSRLAGLHELFTACQINALRNVKALVESLPGQAIHHLAEQGKLRDLTTPFARPG